MAHFVIVHNLYKILHLFNILSLAVDNFERRSPHEDFPPSSMYPDHGPDTAVLHHQEEFQPELISPVS